MPINMQTPTQVAQYKKDLNGCKTNDMPRMASFVTESLGLRMTLLPSLEAIDANNRVVRTPGSGFNVRFRGGMYHTFSSTQVRLIMSSPFYTSGKIVPNPEDPGGFWEEQGLLRVKTVQVVDKGEQGYIDHEQINFDKITAPKEGEESKSRTVVG